MVKYCRKRDQKYIIQYTEGPNATFGSGKNSHKPKFALANYLPFASFRLFYFISAIFGGVCPRNCSNEIE